MNLFLQFCHAHLHDVFTQNSTLELNILNILQLNILQIPTFSNELFYCLTSADDIVGNAKLANDFANRDCFFALMHTSRKEGSFRMI